MVRCMKENNIGYGSINHPVDRDPCCGYSGVIEGHICPKCGRDDSKSEYKFEKIRRITGYLVGTVDRFQRRQESRRKAIASSMTEQLRLASALCSCDSIVDGPGIRMVLWTQGCPHHCAGMPQSADPCL